MSRLIMFELYKQGNSYSEIARQLGISRQRVHQVLKSYKNYGRRSRAGKYVDWGLCKECGVTQARVLHHIDFNNANDELSNLIQLCDICHYRKHGKTILTEQQKRNLAIDYQNNLPIKDILAKYQVSNSTMYKILKLA